MEPTPSTLQNMTDTSKTIMQQIPEMIDKTLGVLANRFGSTGEHLWEALVRYQFAMGVATLACSVILFTIAIYLYYHLVTLYNWALQAHTKGKEVGDREAGNSEGFITLGITCIGLFIAGTITMYNGIIQVVAPEGAAIMNVLSNLHGK